MVVSLTHWDREWRYGMWETRLHLVEMLDELIELLEGGQYPSFLFDGQCVPIEDYLEVRPEMRERVQRLVRARKLLIGPWYTLPDTHPVDGECLVRNLLKGRRVAEALGGCLEIGFTSFGWGLPAQFPQLLAGFGMRFATSSKYLNPARTATQEYLWRSPDGSELLTTRLGRFGRSGFFFLCHQDLTIGKAYMGGDWVYRPAPGQTTFHRAEPALRENDWFLLDAPTRLHEELLTHEKLEEVWHGGDDSVLDSPRLLLDGTDYAGAQPLLPAMIRLFNERDPARDWVHASIEDYVRVALERIDRAQLPVITGELRDGPAYHCSGNALSSRITLKQWNKRAQNALLYAAEPWTVFDWLAGAPYPTQLLARAWRYLLLSHCHDSINGVTQDKTAQDTLYRLSQVVEIARVLQDRALAHFVKRIDLGQWDAGEQFLVVFNPLPAPRGEMVQAHVDLPWDEAIDLFEFEDARGQRYPVQRLARRKVNAPVVERHQRAMPYHLERHEVVFSTGDLPACGYKTFRVVPVRRLNRQALVWPEPLVRSTMIATTPTRLENEWVVVCLHPDGTFDLHDKAQGVVYRGLNALLDTGDIGDYWVRKAPDANQTIVSSGQPARLWLRENGPLQATLCAEVTMLLPVDTDEVESRRSAELAALKVLSSITVRQGQPQVEVNLTFENRHRNHRLSVLLPTGLRDARGVDAGGHFIVDHRPVRVTCGPAGQFYEDMQSQPHQGFVDLSDDRRGLAVLNDCLTEYEMLGDAENTLALTLLRAVKNEICTEFRTVSRFHEQEGGQCLGPQACRYVLLPHAGDWRTGGVLEAAQRLQAPPAVVQTNGGHAGQQPGEAGFMQLRPACLRLSALKRAEDRESVIVRLYNSGAEAVAGSLRLARAPRQAWLVNLNEERQREVGLSAAGNVDFSAPAFGIVTLELGYDG